MAFIQVDDREVTQIEEISKTGIGSISSGYKA